MTTPTKQQIIERARELWFQEQIRNGCTQSIDVNPEVEELRESGFLWQAQQELMRTSDDYAEWLEREYAETTKKSKVEFHKLKPQPFQIDVTEALRSGVYITGTTGSGKSDIGMYVAKEVMKYGVIVIVFDSTQDWQTRSSIPYYITVNRHEPLDIILDHSVVYDIHKLYPNERQKLVERFCAMLYMQQADKPKHMRKQYFIFFEESQTYLWQNSLRSRKAQNTAMLLTEGRNYRVRFGCIVQFSSMVDKNAMRYMKQRFLGWTNEKNDIEYLRSFIGDKVDELKTLKAGQFVYSHPSQNTLKKIEIEPFESATKPKRLQTPSMFPTPKPSIPKMKQNQNDINSLVAFIIALMWLLAILAALSQMR